MKIEQLNQHDIYVFTCNSEANTYIGRYINPTTFGPYIVNNGYICLSHYSNFKNKEAINTVRLANTLEIELFKKYINCGRTKNESFNINDFKSNNLIFKTYI